ncbi:MAG TPA: CCA tRNA nucleotidyltransferase [Candidatus Glassbacteria bacterium]|nr:CCA tRNA nucleotidyltransferase [Candidatus Glassbacteria bacterium]
MKNYEEISDQIIRRICECGWNAYLVGGAVRDEFLGIDASDYDVVTNALPEELEIIFPDRSVKTFGASFLVTSIDNVDVSTYRSDRNFGPGRNNCITEACLTLDEDLSRRDFTFNSLAVCPYTGEVIDPFDGKKDLKNKIVKFVGDPEKRIYEDYLRMMRAARFVCLIEGKLDSQAFKAIYNNRGLIKEISPERIRIELLKVMKYKKPSIFFNVLFDVGILKIILPELYKMYGHTGGKYHSETVDRHSLITGDSLSHKDPILRLAGYLHDIGKPDSFDGESFINHEKIGADSVESVLKRFRFTIKEIERIKNLTLLHMRSIDSLTTNKAIRKFMKILSEHNISFKDWLKLKIADKKANLAKENYTKQEIKSLVLKVYKSKKLTPNGAFGVGDLKINGNDVMQILDIDPGKEVGIILKYLVDIIIDEPEKNEREILIKLIKNG